VAIHKTQRRHPSIEVLHLSASIAGTERIDIDIGQGIQVLYGKNGIGKTRILNSIPKSSITIRRLETPDLARFDGFCWKGWSSFVEIIDYFQEFSLHQGSWWPSFASIRNIVDRLESEFGFVEDLPLSEGLRTRIYAVVSALVFQNWHETVDNDPIPLDTAEQVVASITEWLTTPLMTFNMRSIDYRVILSEAPATTALLQNSNDAMQRRYEDLKKNNFVEAFGDGQDWLNVLLGENIGVLLENLLDDPIGEALGEFPDSSNETDPIGVVALRELIDESNDPHREFPFAFVDELNHPYPAIDRAIRDMFMESDFCLDVLRTRLDPEDLEALEEDILQNSAIDLRSWFDTLKRTPSDDTSEIVYSTLFDNTGPTSACYALCDQLSTEINRIYSMVLSGAPLVVVEARPPMTWANSTRFACRAKDPSGELVDLESLSSTQRRWANFAIQLATTEPDRHPIIILDEPELGLHRQAETHLANGLNQITQELDATVVVASHSPAFLRPDICTLHHVDRNPDNGRVRVAPMGAVGVERVRELGLHPPDLLQNVKTVLLVEGQHEVWVLDELFGEEFQRHGVLVSPLRGAKLLKSAVDAHLLFDFTSANVVVMLDNESTDRIEMIWNEALVAKSSGDNSTVLKALDRLQEVRTGEARYLKDFCVRAIDLDARHRIGFQMMKETDLDRYFAPSAFIRRQKFSEIAAMTWQAIDAIYANWLRENPVPGGGHKEWLRRNYGADFNEKNYRRAVRELDQIPEDFAELFQRICNADG